MEECSVENGEWKIENAKVEKPMSIEQTQNEAVLAVVVIVSVVVALRHLPLALAAFPHWHLVLASLKAALLQQLKVCVRVCVWVCVHFRFALVVAIHGGVRCTSLKCKNKCHAWTKQAHTSTHHTHAHTGTHTAHTFRQLHPLQLPPAPPSLPLQLYTCCTLFAFELKFILRLAC